jgi:hypothetical protein
MSILFFYKHQQSTVILVCLEFADPPKSLFLLSFSNFASNIHKLFALLEGALCSNADRDNENQAARRKHGGGLLFA